MKDKLLKLLALTGSDNDHEALAAVRAANKMLKANNTTWEKIVETNMASAVTANPSHQPFHHGMPQRPNPCYGSGVNDIFSGLGNGL